MTADIDDVEIRRQVAESLRKKFPDTSAEVIEAVVREEFETLASRPVRDYLLVLTERAAKKRLRELAASTSTG